MLNSPLVRNVFLVDLAAVSDADKILRGVFHCSLVFVTHHQQTLESLEPQIWEDEVLESVRKQTIDFAKVKKLELWQSHTAYVRSA
jgi:hypothetical protein